MQTLHHEHLRASTLDALHRSHVPGSRARVKRLAWLSLCVVLAGLFAIGVAVGLLQQSHTGETLPPPPAVSHGR